MTAMTTATNTPGPTNGNLTGPNTNTNTSTSTSTRTRAAMTPVDAIGKISKILDQLAPADRKRVLAFVSEGVE